MARIQKSPSWILIWAENDIDPEINMYNGGLFAPDAVLDGLVMKDTAWKQIVNLNKYDFESELNVNIPGPYF